MVVDAKRIYWGTGGGNIWAINANGSSTSLEQILRSATIKVGAIAVDEKFVYFTDNASHQVYRVSK